MNYCTCRRDGRLDKDEHWNNCPQLAIDSLRRDLDTARDRLKELEAAATARRVKAELHAAMEEDARKLAAEQVARTLQELNEALNGVVVDDADKAVRLTDALEALEQELREVFPFYVGLLRDLAAARERVTVLETALEAEKDANRAIVRGANALRARVGRAEKLLGLREARGRIHFARGESAGSIFTEDEQLAGYTTSGWYFYNDQRTHVHGPFLADYLAAEALEALEKEHTPQTARVCLNLPAYPEALQLVQAVAYAGATIEAARNVWSKVQSSNEPRLEGARYAGELLGKGYQWLFAMAEAVERG